MNTVHYFTSYARDAAKYELDQFPAAVTKSAYIIDILRNIQDIKHIHIVSVTRKSATRWGGISFKKKEYDNKETDYILPSFSSPIKAFRVLNVFLRYISIFFYLMFLVHSDDPVIIYHMFSCIAPIKWACRLKNLFLIMETEEIYGDVHQNEKLKKAELSLMKHAKAFLVPTSLLNSAINKEQKPSIVVHGTYRVEKDRRCHFDDGKIHVLYAGTFDPTKGGTAAAATAAELPAEYHINIIGFGTDAEITYIKEAVKKYNLPGHATVTYDGLLSGEDYIRFVQSCQIGLSTQQPNAPYNETSFPSKVLSYLSNGLHVVSVKIKALETSSVNDLLVYYDNNTPAEIAKAIQSIDINAPFDSREKIKKLDAEFLKDLENLLHTSTNNTPI